MTAPRAASASVSAHNTASVASPNELRRRIERLRVRLAQLRVVRALLLALSAGALTLLVLRLAARILGDPSTASASPPALANGPLSFAVAATVAGCVLWWLASRWDAITPVRAALWYEEHHPSSHAVVTLMELGSEQLPSAIEHRLVAAAAVPTSDNMPAKEALTRAMWQSWRTPLIICISAIASLLLVTFVPSGAIARLTATGGISTTDVASVRESSLGTWNVEVIPPAYSGLPSRSLRDSGTVEALTGSRVRVSGSGDAAALTGALTVRGDSATPETPLPVEEGAQGWHVVTTMPSQPAVIRVALREPSRSSPQSAREEGSPASSRLLVLIPRADSLPQVQLTAPLRDSVYRDTVGTLVLSAEVRDDLGLASAAFELILTSGSGERYSARTITLARKSFRGDRSGAIAHTLSFTELGVAPGDVIHLRAVARDAHPASAREAGISETRSLRFARAEEYDSVAVEAAPPPLVDSSLLSQRMLLDMTEKLEARRPRITREVLVAESRRLAVEQARIRRAVSAIVFQRLSGEGSSEHVHSEGDGHDHGVTLQDGKLVPSFGGATVNVMPGAVVPGMPPRTSESMTDESPIIAVNRPLLEAYNAMWDAGRALELADTRAAIPPMRLALEAIQRARAAERVYLRGRVRAVVVDLARVRLAGRDTGSASRRTAGAALPDPARLADARLVHAAEQLRSDPVAGRDSLVMLRLDVITTAPEFSRALELVLSALTEGRDVTDALVRARRTLVRPAAMRGVSAWSVP